MVAFVYRRTMVETKSPLFRWGNFGICYACVLRLSAVYGWRKQIHLSALFE